MFHIILPIIDNVHSVVGHVKRNCRLKPPDWQLTTKILKTLNILYFHLKTGLIFCLTFSLLYYIYCNRCLFYNVLLHLVRRYAEANSSEAGVHFACRISRVEHKLPIQ